MTASSQPFLTTRCTDMKTEWIAAPHPAYPQEVVIKVRMEIDAGIFYHAKTTVMANVSAGRFWQEINGLQRMLNNKLQAAMH